ncbi:hypothetical protein ACGFX2_33435 [Streptomyces goshikiensis]|uniref:hypothetical protein n=1 Tax=Streptomyces goshikiensis TaxID=1942 RepID=UPI0037230DBA
MSAAAVAELVAGPGPMWHQLRETSFLAPPGTVRVRESEDSFRQKLSFFRNTVAALLTPWPFFSRTAYHAPSMTYIAGRSPRWVD